MRRRVRFRRQRQPASILMANSGLMLDDCYGLSYRAGVFTAKVSGVCGRFIQTSPYFAYAEFFGIAGDPLEMPPRYNLAPSQPPLAARTGLDGKPGLTFLRWGLVPAWSKGPARPRRGAGVPASGDATAGGRAESLDGHSPHRGSDPSGSAAGAPPPPLGARQPFQHDQRPRRDSR